MPVKWCVPNAGLSCPCNDQRDGVSHACNNVNSFGKDPAFYDFSRAMQSYEVTFLGQGADKAAPTTVILSPQNDYLKHVSGKSK